jgi:hypothetical protein
MATKGVIVFRGDYGNPEGHYSKTIIKGVTDDAKLATLITTLSTHTNCNVSQRSFNAQVFMTDAKPGNDSNVDERNIIYFRHPTTLAVHSVTLPAPPDADWEYKPEGERVTDAAVTAVVTAIATATGIAYQAMYGVHITKR